MHHVRLFPPAKMKEKGRHWERQTITPNKRRWKHSKVNSCEFHECHFPFTKTVFRQHNNPLQHLFCLQHYYSTILPFHLPWHGVISLIAVLCLSQVWGQTNPNDGLGILEGVAGSLKIHERTLMPSVFPHYFK